jgi:hypothetical protein
MQQTDRWIDEFQKNKAMNDARTAEVSIRRSPVRTKVHRRIFACFLILGMFGVVVEGVLRFGLGLGNPVLITSDPACSYIVKPDQNIRRFFGHTYINHYGMRSDEVPAMRNPHTLRLMFVGNSITFGTTRVDQQKIFAELLHHDLPSIVHEPVEVLNASAGNWTTDNELSYVRSRGIFQSDIVLLVLDQGDLLSPRSVITDVGSDSAMPFHRGATAIGELWTRFFMPRLSSMLRRGDEGDVANDNSGAIVNANLADLDAFRAIVLKGHAEMVIVYVPSREFVPFASERSAALLRAWTASRHVPLVDITAAELPYSAKEISLPGDIHFNVKGNRMIASAIEQAWPRVVQP